MSQEINQHCEALLEWAKQDKENRAVIVIGYERGEVTKDTTTANVALVQGGKQRNIINALKAALPNDNDHLLNLVEQAVKELAIDNLLDAISDDETETDNTEKTAEK